MDFTQIRYEVADGVATITLDRPERLNAYTRTMTGADRRRSTWSTPTTTCAP